MTFDNWTYADFVNAFAYFRAGKVEDLNRLLTKATGLDYEDMPIEDSAAAKRDMITAMSNFSQELDVSGVRVDFKADNWSDKRYRAFATALAEFRLADAESMIRKVAFMDGVDPNSDTPLTARQGCSMVRAINERYQAVLSGKS